MYKTYMYMYKYTMYKHVHVHEHGLEKQYNIILLPYTSCIPQKKKKWPYTYVCVAYQLNKY